MNECGRLMQQGAGLLRFRAEATLNFFPLSPTLHPPPAHFSFSLLFSSHSAQLVEVNIRDFEQHEFCSQISTFSVFLVLSMVCQSL